MFRIHDFIEISGVGILAGTTEQIRAALKDSQVDQVVALTLGHGNNAAMQALTDTLVNLAPLVLSIISRRQDASFRSIIEALVPETPLAHYKLAEAHMTAQARKAVLESGDWLAASQIAEMAGFRTSNPSAKPNKWKKEGRIFAVRHRGVDYFPAYALNRSTHYRPAEGLRRVLAVFLGQKDNWGLAYWFASANSFLGGRRPQDLLIEQPDRVVAAAEYEVAGVLHG